MKRLLVSAIAISALASCSTTPNYSTKPMDPRNPAASESLANSAGILAQASADLVNVSTRASASAWEGSKQVAGGSWKITKGSAIATKDVVVLGWGVSERSSAVVLGASEDLARGSSKVARSVVTVAGDVFDGFVNASGTAIGVSIEVVKDSGRAIVWSGKKAIGFVSTTAELSAKASQWTSDRTSDVVRWSVTTTGDLLDASGNVIGKVFDASGNAVSFVVDKSGKILRFSEDVSVAIIHGSSDASRQFARDAGQALKASGQSVSAVVTFSAGGTVWLVKWSANSASKSARFIVGQLKDIIHNDVETAPHNPVAN